LGRQGIGVEKGRKNLNKNMALIRKIKLTIFEGRPYEMESKLTGQKYSGFSYKGFNSDGEIIRFSSPDKLKVNDAGQFEDELAVELTLYGREFAGKSKWSTEKPAVSA